ncbi:nocobactin polyketide synthase NbtC [Williamsia muralis]|uniref:nocobactin polyketide synthase NbtC n=1 Tax=Williamsia marianensis TaxID=85044 RepID=UPI0037F3306D
MRDHRLPDGRTAVLLSADSPELLAAEAGALSGYVRDNPTVTPSAVAAMLMRTRVVRRHRALVMASDRDRLAAGLQALADGGDHPDVVRGRGPATRRTTAFVFPGQGSQYPGMGKMFYDASPVFRDEVDRMNNIFVELYGISPRDYLLDQQERLVDADGRVHEDIRVVQPALLMQMIALAQMWRSFGVEPMLTVGHSQGEIAAAYISGAMSLTDVIHVVATRANLVVEFSPTGYSMAVVAIDRDECEALLAEHSGWAELSVVNSPHILCISGDRSTVHDMVGTLTAAGKFAKEIRVDYPAHTSIVSRFRAELGEALADKLENPRFTETSTPCFGGTLGKAMSPSQPLSDYWFWNLRNRVRFDLAVGGAVRSGADTFIEIAEHPTLALAIQENIATAAPDAAMPVIGTSRRSAEDLREFTHNLATVAVNDSGYRWESLAVADVEPIPPLPDFPHVQMARRSLWASHLAPGQELESAVPDEDSALLPRRITETWTRLARRTLVPPRSILLVDHTGRCEQWAADLCAAAPAHGATASMYRQQVPSGSAQFDSVVILLPSGSGDTVPAAIADLSDFFGNRGWLPAAVTDAAECWLVTAAGEHVVPDDPVPHLFHAAANAGFRCLAAEYPRTTFRHLDLPGDSAPSASAVIGALHIAAEPELALRGAKIYAKRLAYVDAVDGRPAPVLGEAAPLGFDDPAIGSGPDDHVVIIGGTGKLGLEFCEYFATRGATRITLLSRSGETASTADRLRHVRSLGGARVDVVACDVGDEASVLQFVSDHVTEPVDVVVHAAVNYVDAESGNITPDLVAAATRSKVVGLMHLLAAAPLAPRCRVVLCSSIAATLGGRGQILYAAGNRMLDVLARTLREQGMRAASVQWGLWNVQGPLDTAGVGRVEGAGVIPMRPADALSVAFTGATADTIVAAADWAELHDIVSMFGHGPLIAGLVPERPPAQLASSVLPTTPSPVTAGSPTASEPAAPEKPAAPTDSAVFAELVVTELHRVMGIDGADIDRTVPLVALGLDSLQALDFRRRVKSELDRDLPVEAILGGASFDEVVRLMDVGSETTVGG